MINIASNSDKIAYGIKHFVLDDESDLKRLNSSKLTPGSTIFIISTSKYCMLNGKKKWIEISPFGKIDSSSGGEGDDPGPDLPEDGEDIVYEGGEI